MSASVPRKVCPACNELTPSSEPACAHCGAAFRSELAWKVPVIVLMFVLAFVLSLWIRSL